MFRGAWPRGRAGPHLRKRLSSRRARVFIVAEVVGVPASDFAVSENVPEPRRCTLTSLPQSRHPPRWLTQRRRADRCVDVWANEALAASRPDDRSYFSFLIGLAWTGVAFAMAAAFF